ncbi:MAG: MarR family transcriptional regulator [Chloroflexota bacterium]
MNRSEIKDSPFHRMHIEPDKDGCLYMVETRDMLKSVGSERLPGIEAMAALRMVGRVMHLNMERWAEQHDLSEGRIAVLFRLRKANDQRLAMSELASGIGVSPRNITGLVDHLAEDGLVERVPDPSDRRSIQAQLTAKGMDKIDSIWRASVDAQTEVTKHFTRDELNQLRHLCLRLVQHMREG